MKSVGLAESGMRHWLLCFLIATSFACGEDGGIMDSDAGGVCIALADCDDGVFCNGLESCRPEDPTADAQGCVAGALPCVEACDESTGTCIGACVDSDADRDGAHAIACGGDDCDDLDPNNFPGNAEVCDPAGHDEDCDADTFGFDIDGDGFVADRCCNGDRCGQDCNDLAAGAFPGATETCNEVDDDCDGDVDEGVTLTFFVDADRDGFGLDDAPTLEACRPPDGYALMGGDCDDTSAFAFPGGAERCAPPGTDEDCDGEVDEFGPDVESGAVDLVTFYPDDDRDGWGVTDGARVACAPPGARWSRFPGDCRDDLPQVNPAADFATEPACPSELRVGDLEFALEPRNCGGTWVCAVDGVCGNPRQFPAHWDLDCDGEVRDPGFASCTAPPDACGPGFSQPPGPRSPGSCGGSEPYILPSEPIRCEMTAGRCELVGTPYTGVPCR